MMEDKIKIITCNKSWFYFMILLGVIRRFVVYSSDEPVGESKIQTTSENSQRYYMYTTKRLIRNLLSNTPKCYVRADKFHGYLFTGNAWQRYVKGNGIGARNPANWLVNSRKPVSPPQAVLWSTNTTWYLYLFWASYLCSRKCSWIIKKSIKVLQVYFFISIPPTDISFTVHVIIPPRL